MSSAAPTRTSTSFADAGAREVGARDLGMPGLGLQRDHAAAGGQRARQPDRAVAGERADLEDRARALHARQQVQQLALIRRHVDGRQAGGFARLERRRRAPRRRAPASRRGSGPPQSKAAESSRAPCSMPATAARMIAPWEPGRRWVEADRQLHAPSTSSGYAAARRVPVRGLVLHLQRLPRGVRRAALRARRAGSFCGSTSRTTKRRSAMSTSTTSRHC